MIPTLPFGRTGFESSRAIFGAAALSAMKPQRSDALMADLMERGVNHIDTAAGYGESELRLAPFLQDHRTRVFLATKTAARDAKGARAGLENSLERLGVPQVDLIQMHNLVDEAEWEQAMGPGGALEALVKARDEGLTRFIGVTGHGTRAAEMHVRSLERFDFDSVLAPYNFSMMADPVYARDFETLDSLCRERGVALQTIKSVARRRWRPPGTTVGVADEEPQKRFSWYEPLRDRAAIRRAVHWTFARPGVFLNTSSDATILPAILDAAAEPRSVVDRDAMELDARTFAIEPLFVRGESDSI